MVSLMSFLMLTGEAAKAAKEKKAPSVSSRVIKPPPEKPTTPAAEYLKHLQEIRLDRTNLLLYQEKNGTVAGGKTLSDWKKRRAQIYTAIQEVMGPLPGDEKRCPLDVKVEEEVDCGSYVRRFLTYSSEPNSRVPAYLLIPKIALQKKTMVPAALVLHPTEMTLGHKVVVGLGGKEHRDYGRELAERGYLVLAPAYPLMANYQPDLKKLGYQSGTMKAIWDNMRGIDLIETFPFVRYGRLVAIGHSLGGHNAIYTAVFDERIRVVVSSCGFDSFLDYKNGDITGWTQERYMPRLRDYPLEKIPFDFHELLGALVPRAIFVNAPKGDSNFKWQSVDRIWETIQPIYKLHGAEKRLHLEHPDCDHDFPDAQRQAAYKFLDENLK